MSSKKDSALFAFIPMFLGLEHLHYGLWDADAEVTLANLKTAQANYQQAIIDLLPPPARRGFWMSAAARANCQRH